MELGVSDVASAASPDFSALAATGAAGFVVELTGAGEPVGDCVAVPPLPGEPVPPFPLEPLLALSSESMSCRI